MDIAKEVKEMRLRLGLTQKELSKKLGVSLSTVARWEQGLFKPSLKAYMKLKEIEDCNKG